ncbi:MAG TPA: aminopeptidase P N-terminal domain-containing protein [Candidatus Acidoferrum sp.]|nr:aminopeptidase P N-terminal domain-containing protein [Candidatus Acidoferrum sp.]
MAAVAILALLFMLSCAPEARSQQRREREPNSAYAERRRKLAAQADGPVILWGFTGREEVSQAYVFTQEENFYYLTGHNEEEAGLIILPVIKNDVTGDGWEGPREILFLPEKNPAKEKWNGVRVSPSDPGIEARTGFSAVKPFPEMRAHVEKLAKLYSNFFTILPYEKELGGYPHEKAVFDWLQLAAPQAKLKDIRPQISSLRQIKSPGEIAFLKQAIELSLDAQLEAMKIMRPGLYEYQVSAKMVEIHAWGGSEAEGYAPIVGAGPNSTALHYDKLSRRIEDRDIVVLDVGAQYSGYSADITRTIPANGKFTPRQREIYEIVLGAQNAALAAIKPGANFSCKGKKGGLMNIAYDYINSHGNDLHGKTLGPYFIHGLGHHIGLNVHDPGEYCAPLQPGMVVTVEPGIYIPEENLGVRIEDDVLITETGYKFLSELLPRDPVEIETIMEEAAKDRVRTEKSSAGENSNTTDNSAASEEIKSLIAKYAKSIDGADTKLASLVWWDSPEASFIHPLGHEHGFVQIQENVYKRLMGETFSERKLSIHDVSVHVFGDAAWAEFDWDFAAKFRKDGSPLTTHGRETQLYRKTQDGWRLVHVHYSGMPVAAERQGF